MLSESSSFHTAIFDALCACLNLDRNSADAIALIHEAYAEPESVPRPPRNRNVIYWTVLRDPSADPAAAVTAEEPAAGATTAEQPAEPAPAPAETPASSDAGAGSGATVQESAGAGENTATQGSTGAQ